MVLVERILRPDLPSGQSAFLWGPRKTGKTTLLRELFPRSLRYDLLDTDLFFALSRRPATFREQILAHSEETLRDPVIVDEIQKVPQLLDEIHWLIENRSIRFILSGSSARKLRRGHANLLGGRAWSYRLHPLVTAELGEVSLLEVLNRGLVPSHYLQSGYRRSLKAYLFDYLKEEVFDEGLTRNVPAFSRFFESMGYSHGEMTNFSNVARDCGVDAKTVREYYQILVDTLIGTWVPPFKKRQDRHVILKASKFYLFDVGVAGALTSRNLTAERGEAYGRAFEHLVLMELTAHSSYRECDYPIEFWRTKSGLEVDFVLGSGQVAIEAKGSGRVDDRELRALATFTERYKPQTSIVVCNEARERRCGSIRVMPWAKFFRELWAGLIIS